VFTETLSVSAVPQYIETSARDVYGEVSFFSDICKIAVFAAYLVIFNSAVWFFTKLCSGVDFMHVKFTF
jgi:hypothetical protein